MPALNSSATARTSDLGDEFARGLTTAQARMLHELSSAAFAAARYQDLVALGIGFFEQIGAGATNYAIFDNQDFSLVGFSTSMRAAVLDQVEDENIGPSDPLLRRIAHNINPAIVGFGLGVTADWTNEAARRMVEVLEENGYFGLLFVPVRMQGGAFSAAITVATELTPDAAYAYLEQNSTFMVMAAQILGARATQLFQSGDIDGSWRSRRLALLSSREHQVVRALSRGDRPEQIAYQLNIKPVTVHMHVASARQKLDARTREQLVSLALQKGLV